MQTQCRYFNGYKPCGKSDSCDENCTSRNIPSTRILIIHLEALGAVMRSTALLAPIRRKYTNSHITWVTQKPADQLLANNPFIDKIVPFDPAFFLSLTAQKFDVCFCIDKSVQATGLAAHIQSEMFFGFRLEEQTGAIATYSSAADELWGLGLSDRQKFFVNQKPETQLTCEALELNFIRDPYVLKLTPTEQAESYARRKKWSQGSKKVVGINTGCSNVIAYKKLSVNAHRELIESLKGFDQLQIVLLGGKEDQARNNEIAEGLDVIQSPTNAGLRDGIVSVDACDIVVSGDSLGMHIAIGLKKWVVAWFGPTCSQEIDLFDRGVKLLSEAQCGPCWKRVCHKSTMCYELVDNEKLVKGVLLGLETHHEPKNISHSDGLHR